MGCSSSTSFSRIGSRRFVSLLLLPLPPFLLGRWSIVQGADKSLRWTYPVVLNKTDLVNGRPNLPDVQPRGRHPHHHFQIPTRCSRRSRSRSRRGSTRGHHCRKGRLGRPMLRGPSFLLFFVLLTVFVQSQEGKLTILARLYVTETETSRYGAFLGLLGTADQLWRRGSSALGYDCFFLFRCYDPLFDHPRYQPRSLYIVRPFVAFPFPFSVKFQLLS
jgi:hypothetical protein